MASEIACRQDTTTRRTDIQKVGQSLSTFLKLLDDRNGKSEENIIRNQNNAVIRTVNYNLDKERTVTKKLAAVNRTEKFTAKYTTNGGKILVIYSQAGLYEMLRKAVISYYVNFRSHTLECETTYVRDKSSGHIVQNTY